MDNHDNSSEYPCGKWTGLPSGQTTSNVTAIALVIHKIYVVRCFLKTKNLSCGVIFYKSPLLRSGNQGEIFENVRSLKTDIANSRIAEKQKSSWHKNESLKHRNQFVG